MKAIVYSEYGPPGVLRIADIAKPTPGDGDVLIRVRATEVTKSDCEMRSFAFPVKWFWLPLRLVFGITRPKRQVLGFYFSGEVEAVGRSVSKLAVGEKVFGSSQLRLGAYGEYVCVPEDYPIVSKPSNMSFEEAAAVPLGGWNALHFMRRAGIREGEKVLINGAGGSIGTFAVQIAKHMGAEVTAVDAGIKEAMLRRIGADHFVDYAREDFTRSARRYDVIFDMVAKSSYSRSVAALSPGGRYLLGNPRLSDMVRSVVTSRVTDKNVFFAFAKETEEELLKLKTMIEAGNVRSTLDRVYPMEKIAEAHRRVETEQRLGSVVLSL